MLNLIKKDLLLTFSSKQSVIIMLLYVPFILFVMGTQNEFTVTLMIYTFVYMLTTISFGYEMQTKTHIMLQSLPIKKRNIVISKYLAVLINYVFGFVFTWGYLWILSLMGFVSVDNFNISLIKVTMPVIVLSLAISLPALFRLPFKIANFVNMMIYICTMNFVIIPLSRSSLSQRAIFDGIGLISVSVILYLVSIGLSIWLYETRDFA